MCDYINSIFQSIYPTWSFYILPYPLSPTPPLPHPPLTHSTPSPITLARNPWQVGGVTCQQIAVYDEFARSIPGFVPGSNVAMQQATMEASNAQLAHHQNINQAKLKV